MSILNASESDFFHLNGKPINLEILKELSISTLFMEDETTHTTVSITIPLFELPISFQYDEEVEVEMKIGGFSIPKTILKVVQSWIVMDENNLEADFKYLSLIE